MTETVSLSRPEQGNPAGARRSSRAVLTTRNPPETLMDQSHGLSKIHSHQRNRSILFEPAFPGMGTGRTSAQTKANPRQTRSAFHGCGGEKEKNHATRRMETRSWPEEGKQASASDAGVGSATNGQPRARSSRTRSGVFDVTRGMRSSKKSGRLARCVTAWNCIGF